MLKLGSIGIIGGTGWLGLGIIRQLLTKQLLEEKNLWVSNRSGKRTGLSAWPNIHVTNINQELANHCDTVILAVRPADFPSLKINLDKQLVISIMAGVEVKRIREVVGGKDIVRAMPNAALEIGESYTPWYSEHNLSTETANAVQLFFAALGKADRVKQEDDINFFTALTGSGQGWIAFMQNALIQCATHRGVSPQIAERAIRQLFLGMGKLLAESDISIEEHIKILTKYAGTTAAGLIAMSALKIDESIEKAILASYQKASSDMSKR